MLIIYINSAEIIYDHIIIGIVTLRCTFFEPRCQAIGAFSQDSDCNYSILYIQKHDMPKELVDNVLPNLIDIKVVEKKNNVPAV